MATGTGDIPTHTHVNMVAQPVDTISAAPSFRDAMSSVAGSMDGKEADVDLSGEFDLSEDPPAKDHRGDGDTSATHVSTNKYRWHRTPRTSPSPSRSKGRRPSLPRTIPVKRSSSTPTSAIPMMPRRGRVAVTDGELWGTTGRLVHRKVEGTEAVGGDIAAAMPLIAEQFTADRAASNQLYMAVQALARAVNAHDGDLKEHERRLDEQTRLRFDDNKLHQGGLLHVRTGIEELAEKTTSQDKFVFETLTKSLDEVVPRLIEEKLAAVKVAFGEIKAT